MATGDVYNEGSGVFSQKVRIVSAAATLSVSLSNDFTRELGKVRIDTGGNMVRICEGSTTASVRRARGDVPDTAYGLVVLALNYAYDSGGDEWEEVHKEDWASNF